MSTKLILVGSNAKKCDKIAAILKQTASNDFDEIESFISEKHHHMLSLITPNNVNLKYLVHETLGFKDIGFLCNAIKGATAIAFLQDLGQDIDTIKAINAVINETSMPCIVDRINIVRNNLVSHSGPLLLVFEEQMLDQILGPLFNEVDIKKFAADNHLTLVSLGNANIIANDQNYSVIPPSQDNADFSKILFEVTHGSSMFDAAFKAYHG